MAATKNDRLTGWLTLRLTDRQKDWQTDWFPNDRPSKVTWESAVRSKLWMSGLWRFRFSALNLVDTRWELRVKIGYCKARKISRPKTSYEERFPRPALVFNPYQRPLKWMRLTSAYPCPISAYPRHKLSRPIQALSGPTCGGTDVQTCKRTVFLLPGPLPKKGLVSLVLIKIFRVFGNQKDFGN